jgi:hypothetical protein
MRSARTERGRHRRFLARSFRIDHDQLGWLDRVALRRALRVASRTRILTSRFLSETSGRVKNRAGRKNGAGNENKPGVKIVALFVQNGIGGIIFVARLRRVFHQFRVRRRLQRRERLQSELQIRKFSLS